MYLTEQQHEWLSSRGGRTSEDVRIDEKGRKYVLMSVGYYKSARVYLPRRNRLTPTKVA